MERGGAGLLGGRTRLQGRFDPDSATGADPALMPELEVPEDLIRVKLVGDPLDNADAFVSELDQQIAIWLHEPSKRLIGIPPGHALVDGTLTCPVCYTLIGEQEKTYLRGTHSADDREVSAAEPETKGGGNRCPKCAGELSGRGWCASGCDE